MTEKENETLPTVGRVALGASSSSATMIMLMHDAPLLRVRAFASNVAVDLYMRADEADELARLLKLGAAEMRERERTGH